MWRKRWAKIESIPEPVAADAVALALTRCWAITCLRRPAAPVKLKRGDAPLLVLDPHSRTYLGPTALKASFRMASRDTAPMSGSPSRPPNWSASRASSAERSPTYGCRARALVAGDGPHRARLRQNQKFPLKLPHIEREFPKHFRIATAMMKGRSC